MCSVLTQMQEMSDKTDDDGEHHRSADRASFRWTPTNRNIVGLRRRNEPSRHHLPAFPHAASLGFAHSNYGSGSPD